MKQELIATETLIIGFGFSAIPLIRELERDGKDYLVISEGKSIWCQLEERGRLDFDLVSSKLTSLYSFELVNQDTKDCYPTAREFLEFQRKYQKQYESRVVKDWVTEVRNWKSHSLVYTKTGRVFKATHLVIATAFRRKMNKSLTHFDYDSADQNTTVVFTTFGDSANLMLSKLIPKKVRVVLVTNGFICLDKLSFYDGASYTLDQLEFHNFRYLSVRYVSKFIYRMLIGWAGSINLVAELLPGKLAKILFGDLLHAKYPLTSRLKKLISHARRDIKSPMPSGLIMVKYWPIDAYQRLFDNGGLEQSIQKGYLLNDIAFFIDNHLVEIWPAEETAIDRETNTIRWQDTEIAYDHLIEGDREVPNLPTIVAESEDSSPTRYEYEYRDNFLGVIPKDLHHVYLIGYTRPSTGGSCNIIEMQCLLTHRMITDSAFNEDIYRNIESRIENYNREYYTTSKKRNIDHLVYYGYYTYDVAKLLGIAPTLSDCRSIKDVLQYYLSPNNAYRFRQDGPYKVEGAKEMSEKIWKEHKEFRFIKHFVLNYFLIQITSLALIVLLPIPFYVIVLLCLIQVFNPFVGFLQSYGTGLHKYFNLVFLIGLVAIGLYPSPWTPATALLCVAVITLIGRKMAWTRLLFNDLKHKRRYKEFFGRYVLAFRNVLEANKEGRAPVKPQGRTAVSRT